MAGVRDRLKHAHKFSSSDHGVQCCCPLIVMENMVNARILIDITVQRRPEVMRVFCH